MMSRSRLSTLNISSSCLLKFMASEEKSAANLILHPLYEIQMKMNHFSLAFKILFVSFDIMSLGMDLFSLKSCLSFLNVWNTLVHTATCLHHSFHVGFFWNSNLQRCLPWSLALISSTTPIPYFALLSFTVLISTWHYIKYVVVFIAHLSKKTGLCFIHWNPYCLMQYIALDKHLLTERLHLVCLAKWPRCNKYLGLNHAVLHRCLEL
jgi:hypothetical protein